MPASSLVETLAASYAIPGKDELRDIYTACERVIRQERQTRSVKGGVGPRTIYASSSVIAQAQTTRASILAEQFSADLEFVSRVNDGTYYALTARDVSRSPRLRDGQPPGRMRVFVAGYLRNPAFEPLVEQGRPGILPPEMRELHQQLRFLNGDPMNNGAKLGDALGCPSLVKWKLPVYAGPLDFPKDPLKGRIALRDSAAQRASDQALYIPEDAAEIILPSPVALAQAIFDRLIDLAPLNMEERQRRLPLSPGCSATFTDSGLLLQLADSPPIGVPWSLPLLAEAANIQNGSVPDVGWDSSVTLLGVKVTEPWGERHSEELLSVYVPHLPQGFQPHSNVAWGLAWALHERLRRAWYRGAQREGLEAAQSSAVNRLKAKAQDSLLRGISGASKKERVSAEISKGIAIELEKHLEGIAPHAGARANSYVYLWLMEDNSIAYRMDLELGFKSFVYLKDVVRLERPLASVSGWIRNAKGEAGTSEGILAFAARRGGILLTAEIDFEDPALLGIVEATFGLLLKRAKNVLIINELGGGDSRD